MSGPLIFWCMAHVQINNILYLKSPINVNKCVEETVNIHNPLTALLCFGITPKIDSSYCTINYIWLSEQQAAQMCNFGRKHERYLAAMPEVPNLGYICLSEGVRLRLAIKEKLILHIIYFRIFIHISVNIFFKNRYMLVLKNTYD